MWFPCPENRNNIPVKKGTTRGITEYFFIYPGFEQYFQFNKTLTFVRCLWCPLNSRTKDQTVHIPQMWNYSIFNRYLIIGELRLYSDCLLCSLGTKGSATGCPYSGLISFQRDNCETLTRAHTEWEQWKKQSQLKIKTKEMQLREQKSQVMR